MHLYTIPFVLVGLIELESLNRSNNVVEAIGSDIDKERIRKEIIAEEVARKQMLELEVRRLLIMEREIAMFGGDRFASFFMNQADSMLFKENMRMGISVVSRYDMDHILETPFRHRAVEPNISTLNQSPKAEILQVQPPSAKPDTIFSGKKWKAITLIEEVADKPVKNVTEWNCELCQVSTTNQDCLNAHFQGKKHKRKEESKDWSIGLFPKNSKFIQLVERPCDVLLSSPNVNDPPSLLIDNNAENFRNNKAQEKQNNREFTFWCETCKIGTFSEKTMEAHRVGKKHVWHLQQLTGKDKQC
uniref:U1-type domain-containing protein n=1 Tax=Solanum tuberosum TaxID=4113 RepID=M1DCJ2_SOLTU